MIYGKQIIRAHMDGFNPFAGISISMFMQNGDQVSVALPATFKTMEPNEYNAEPMFRIQREAGQELMDELWRVGLRPSEGSGSAGALAAVERHLADMRAIALTKIGVKPL